MSSEFRFWVWKKLINKTVIHKLFEILLYYGAINGNRSSITALVTIFSLILSHYTLLLNKLRFFQPHTFLVYFHFDHRNYGLGDFLATSETHRWMKETLPDSDATNCVVEGSRSKDSKFDTVENSICLESPYYIKILNVNLYRHWFHYVIVNLCDSDHQLKVI